MCVWNFCIIKRSSSRTFGSVGMLVGEVKDKDNSELVLHVIISSLVGEFERCDAMGVVHSKSLVMKALNNDAGVLVLFLLVKLAKFMEEFGVDAFEDPK
eukprot:4042476-Ditylum_brightwellii.AAC.1